MENDTIEAFANADTGPGTRYQRIPPEIGGYVLATTLWASCLPLVDELFEIGVRAYCPVVWECRRSARRGTKRTPTPAFGGYFWLPNGTEIVPDRIASRFRRFYHEGFYWFSEDEIDAVREIEAGWPVLRPDAMDRARFGKGAEIEVILGPFQGRTGTVLSDSGARVKVSLPGFVMDLPPFMVAATSGTGQDSS